MGIYRSLENEWRHVGSSPRAAASLACWAASEPDLAAYEHPCALVEHIAVPGCTEEAHRTLRAILRLAGDELATRTFLQAMLPALRGSPIRGVPQDCCAQRVASAWETIRLHAGESPPYPVRYILRIAERRLRTEREAVERRQRRLTVLDPDRHSHAAAQDLHEGRTAEARVAAELIGAYQRGAITVEQMRLLYATAVVGLRASEAGRAAGLPGRSVYRHLDAARAALATTCGRADVALSA